MKLKYFIGFLLASIIQTGIVIVGESSGISTLTPKFSILQFLTHIIVGQIAGWILLYTVNNLEFIAILNRTFVGLVYGLLVWSFVLPTAANQGAITTLWAQGTNLVVSLTAFLVFGLMTAYTVYLDQEAKL